MAGDNDRLIRFALQRSNAANGTFKGRVKTLTDSKGNPVDLQKEFKSTKIRKEAEDTPVTANATASAPATTGFFNDTAKMIQGELPWSQYTKQNPYVEPVGVALGGAALTGLMTSAFSSGDKEDGGGSWWSKILPMALGGLVTYGAYQYWPTIASWFVSNPIAKQGLQNIQNEPTMSGRIDSAKKLWRLSQAKKAYDAKYGSNDPNARVGFWTKTKGYLSPEAQELADALQDAQGVIGDLTDEQLKAANLSRFEYNVILAKGKSAAEVKKSEAEAKPQTVSNVSNTVGSTTAGVNVPASEAQEVTTPTVEPITASKALDSVANAVSKPMSGMGLAPITPKAPEAPKQAPVASTAPPPVETKEPPQDAAKPEVPAVIRGMGLGASTINQPKVGK